MKVVGALFAVIIASIAWLAVKGFVLMLALDMAHSVVPQVPALGYGASVLIAFAVSIVLQIFQGSSE